MYNETNGRRKLEIRLKNLAERELEALALLIARNALRALTRTVYNGVFGFGQPRTNSTHVQSLFVASVLGLEIHSLSFPEISAAAEVANNGKGAFVITGATPGQSGLNC
ncbi:MAG: hypothetical protein KDF49_04090, partial [Nitrosomonas sp.]|nr:hypothetical protein [Nitrosomonas sp.]